MVKIGFGMKLLILVIFSNQIIFSLVFESRQPAGPGQLSTQLF